MGFRTRINHLFKDEYVGLGFFFLSPSRDFALKDRFQLMYGVDHITEVILFHPITDVILEGIQCDHFISSFYLSFAIFRSLLIRFLFLRFQNFVHLLILLIVGHKIMINI